MTVRICHFKWDRLYHCETKIVSDSLEMPNLQMNFLWMNKQGLRQALDYNWSIKKYNIQSGSEKWLKLVLFTGYFNLNQNVYYNCVDSTVKSARSCVCCGPCVLNVIVPACMYMHSVYWRVPCMCGACASLWNQKTKSWPFLLWRGFPALRASLQ